MTLDPRELLVTAAIVGTLVAWVRNLPIAAGRWFRAQFLVSVEVRDPEIVKWVGVTAVERWALPNRRTAAVRRVIREKTDFVLEPARGVHVLRYRGSWALLDRGKENGAGKNIPDSVGLPSVETVVLRAWGRDPRRLHEMIAEAVEYGRERFAEQSLVRIAEVVKPAELRYRNEGGLGLVGSIHRGNDLVALIEANGNISLPRG